MDFAIIGNAAIAQYVIHTLEGRGHRVVAQILRPQRIEQSRATGKTGRLCVARIGDLPDRRCHLIDCAGHEGLASHGPDAPCGRATT